MQAEIILIGEQPGDKEDLAGRPFVGPAGAVLNESLSRAGIDRERCYITNTVKHFKFTQRGKRRLHSKPNAGEIRQCAWWLRSELKLIEPKIIVALGATAAGYLVGKAVRITKDRGTIFRPQNLPPVLVTIHPSYILRMRDRHTANAEQIKFVHDLNRLKEVLDQGRVGAAKSDIDRRNNHEPLHRMNCSANLLDRGATPDRVETSRTEAGKPRTRYMGSHRTVWRETLGRVRILMSTKLR